MKNKSDNLENFIKNKFNELDGQSDGWDVPDADVWGQAVNRMPVATQPAAFYKMPFLKLAAGAVLLLLAGGYMFLLNQKVNTLETALNQQKIIIEKSDEQILNNEKETGELIAENKHLKKENNLIKKEKTVLEKTSIEQRRTINFLKNKNEIIQEKKKERSFFKKEIIENEKAAEKNLLNLPTDQEEFRNLANRNALAPDLLNLKDLVNLTPTTINNLNIPSNIFSKKITPIKKRNKKIEIGYEYNFSKIKIPSVQDFKDIKTIDKNSANNVFNVKFHGLNMAFSPKRNLFIKTGFRKAVFDTHQNIKTGWYYDKDQEYTKPDGTVGNNLALAMNTPYSKQESAINIDVPEDVDIKSGDVLVVHLEEYQTVESYQVPLGLQYFFSENRLQWFLEGGLQWNKMVFSDYKLTAEIEDVKSDQWEVDGIDYFSKPSFSDQFFSAYGGLGINYHLIGNWQIRAAYNCQFNFIKNKKEFSNSELNSTSINLGLNYRF